MTINATTLLGAETVEGSIKNWVNRGDIPITDILRESELFIFQRLRTREMLSSAALTVSTAASTAALPTDFLDPIGFRPYEQNVDLPYVNEAELNRNRDSSGNLFDGTPIAYTIIGTTFTTDVNALSDFSGIMTYYAIPDALAATTNETNFLTDRYPTMLRRACMRFAYEFMKDAERMAAEEILALKAIEEANAANELYRRAQEHPSARYY